MRLRSCSNCAGFTKKEFLALAGCVVLLLALGGSFISHWATRSHDAVCVRRLDQLGQAMLAYAQSQQRFPSSAPLGKPREDDWLFWQPTRALANSALARHDPLLTPEELLCPSDDRFEDRQFQYSYTMSEKLDRGNPEQFGTAGMILLAEEVAPNDGSWAPGHVDDQLTKRHRGHANVIFADGHAQQIEAAEADRSWWSGRASAQKETQVVAAPAFPAIPGSAAQAVGQPVDLSGAYSCTTSNAISMGNAVNHPNNLSSFPIGTNGFGGIRFAVGGMIQLGSPYPRQALGIKVGAKAKRLHLLHGTGGLTRDGTEIAMLVLHYAEGEPAQLPIQYGEQVRDWWMWKPDESPFVGPGSAMVWQGENEFSKSKNCRIRVFASTFDNPNPEKVIESIDYIRSRTSGSTTPFLLGLTLE